MIAPSVIVAEDNVSFYSLFEITLQDVGIPLDNYRLFQRAEEALKFFQAYPPPTVHLAFIDIKFEGEAKTGFDILESIRDNDNIIKVIVSTSDSPKDIEKAKSLGAHAYVKKEVNFESNIFENRMRAVKEEYLDQGQRDFEAYV